MSALMWLAQHPAGFRAVLVAIALTGSVLILWVSGTLARLRRWARGWNHEPQHGGGTDEGGTHPVPRTEGPPGPGPGLRALPDDDRIDRKWGRVRDEWLDEPFTPAPQPEPLFGMVQDDLWVSASPDDPTRDFYGHMTRTGPMPKITGDRYDLPAWEKLPDRRVETRNLPPWEDAPVLGYADGRPHAGSAEQLAPTSTGGGEGSQPPVPVPGPDLLDLLGFYEHADPGGQEAPLVAGLDDRGALVEAQAAVTSPDPGSREVAADIPPAAVVENADPLPVRVLARVRASWLGLLGGPDPLPGPVTSWPVEQGVRGAGEPVLEGVVLTAGPIDYAALAVPSGDRLAWVEAILDTPLIGGVLFERLCLACDLGVDMSAGLCTCLQAFPQVAAIELEEVNA